MSLPSKTDASEKITEPGNQLFPVFLKLNQLQVLLVGAGYVGMEKLSALLQNSPEAKITIVAPQISAEVKTLAARFPQIILLNRGFEEKDLEEKDLLVVATDQPLLNREISELARKQRLLVNVADKPDLCDFYLGSIVQKGDLKLAISTNGKSPTVAKRLKEVLQVNIPDELNDTLQQINKLRMKNDFKR